MGTPVIELGEGRTAEFVPAGGGRSFVRSRNGAPDSVAEVPVNDLPTIVAGLAGQNRFDDAQIARMIAALGAALDRLCQARRISLEEMLEGVTPENYHPEITGSVPW